MLKIFLPHNPKRNPGQGKFLLRSLRQWFPGDQFAIGLGIGVDYYFFSGDSNDENFNDYNGFAPALRFDIGYAW